MKSVNLAICIVISKFCSIEIRSFMQISFSYTEGATKFFELSGNRKRPNLNKEKKPFCWIWEPVMKDTVPCRPYLHTAFASTPPQQLIVSPAVGRCHHEKRWQHEVNALSASCFMHLKNLRLPTLQHETCRKTEYDASPSQLTQSLHTRQITSIKKVITIKL